MINLFKRNQPSVAAVIDAIHKEFYNTGDKLLAEANQIIARSAVHNEEKAEKLKRFGFTNSNEVVAANEIIAARDLATMVARAITALTTKFPQYKFITREAAEKICEKYNLVIGEVKQYKGFVPAKNLQDIERFFEGENILNAKYYEYLRGSGRLWEIDKNTYEANKNREDNPMYVKKDRVQLHIAAPRKDMETKGYKLVGKFFEKEIPDPVVLAPVKIGHVRLFCIVTAWGDEASDEMVVNEKMN